MGDSVEKAKFAVSQAGTRYEQARASAFMRAHDEAVRRFRYPPGRPVPTKVLEMIVEASPEVAVARRELDAATGALVEARAGSKKVDEAPGGDDDGLLELAALSVPGHEAAADEIFGDVARAVDQIAANVGDLKDLMNGTDDDAGREFWEDLLQEFLVNASDLTEHVATIRLILRRVRSKAAAALVKGVLDAARDVRKDGRDLADLCKIKLRGW